MPDLTRLAANSGETVSPGMEKASTRAYRSLKKVYTEIGRLAENPPSQHLAMKQVCERYTLAALEPARSLPSKVTALIANIQDLSEIAFYFRQLLPACSFRSGPQRKLAVAELRFVQGYRSECGNPFSLGPR